MKIFELKYNNFNKTIASSVLVLVSWFSFAQVKSSVDTTLIKIGEQITFKVQVDTDTTNVVLFPEGQTFLPLEMIESFPIDTTKKDAKYKLIKKYGLTQFDSGGYTIPKQKVVIGDKVFYTDSLKVEVSNVVVDTTKQGLYDIKPIIGVEKQGLGNWWKWLLFTLSALALVAFLLYWFIWRKKPLTEEEKEALLSPYERAKLALDNLDNSTYLENSEIKRYYSELTLAIRKFIDEKVYDRALESTTDQLVDRLKLLKDGNQFDFTNDTIRNIETILRRADLVKFAKSAPDLDLARLDRETIGKEVDNVKTTLPEPTEEEKLLNIQYKQEQERKAKRRKTILTVAISLFLLIATFAGFSIKYGLDYVKDTIIGHASKELLEGKWVKSEYGYPPILIETPKVLRRIPNPISKEVEEKVDMSTFIYGSMIDNFSIVLTSTRFKDEEGKIASQEDRENQAAEKIGIAIEGNLKVWEQRGVQNIITKNDKFTTPNGAQGVKTYGRAEFPLPVADKFLMADYVMLTFASENVLQQVVLISKQEDVYAKKMVERILDSIELQAEKPENNQEEEE